MGRFVCICNYKINSINTHYVFYIRHYYVQTVLRGDSKSTAEIDHYVEKQVRNVGPTKQSFVQDDKFIKDLVKAINEYQLKL